MPSTTPTLASLEAEHPQLVRPIRETAALKAVSAERARILAIEDLPGRPALKRACQEDGGCTVGDAALKLLEELAAAEADDATVRQLLAAAERTGVGVSRAGGRGAPT